MAGRDDSYGEWSHAGAVGQLGCGGPWVANLPDDVRPEPGTEAGEAYAKDCEEGIIEDRRYDSNVPCVKVTVGALCVASSRIMRCSRVV